MVQKSGNDFQLWLKDGELGVILLHLLDCVAVAVVSLLIFGVLYLYYENRDKNLPKTQEIKPAVVPQVPPHSTLNETEFGVDVRQTPIKSPTGAPPNSLSGEKDAKPLQKDDKPKVDDKTKTEPQKESAVKSQNGETVIQKESKPETKSQVGQSGPGLGAGGKGLSPTNSKNEKSSAKPNTQTQNGSNNEVSDSEKPKPKILVIKSDISDELEVEDPEN